MVKFSFIFSQSNANKMIWLGPIEVPFITTVDRNLFKKRSFIVQVDYDAKASLIEQCNLALVISDGVNHSLWSAKAPLKSYPQALIKDKNAPIGCTISYRDLR